jgi:hypothetical protein
MAKSKVPVELQAILRDLAIVESDDSRLLAKVHARAALQVNDYIQIMLSKFQVRRSANAALRTSMAEVRLVLHGVQHGEDGGEEQREAEVVV